MIPATKRALFTAWFSRDAERRIRRSFSRVLARGLPELRARVAQGPVLVISNHTAWWDPLVAILLCHRVLGADAYAMMDANNLRALPFFGRVGAFGVDREDPADGARAIRYAAKLLTAPGRVVWIFPQGREIPATVRPLGFLPGSSEIARISRAASVVPVGLRYEMGSRPEPSLWISIGDALARERDVKIGRHVHERAVTAELDRIERAVAAAEAGDFELLSSKSDGVLLRAATAALAWLTKPRALR